MFSAEIKTLKNLAKMRLDVHSITSDRLNVGLQHENKTDVPHYKRNYAASENNSVLCIASDNKYHYPTVPLHL